MDSTRPVDYGATMSADEEIRARVSGLPAPAFDPIATTVAPPLAEARVAIVTTAGLRPAGEIDLWRPGDFSFTVLAGDARDFQLSHFSPNFDRAGITADLNVVLPADRLAELAAAGTIGSVATNHLSFMGAQTDETFATLRLDTGLAAAKLLRDDEVDVVLLTPV